VQTALDFLARWQFLGLFLILLAEEGGIPLPIPGDIFIAAVGVAAASSGLVALEQYALTTLVVTGATLLGAGILYVVAARLGRPLLLKVARRFGYTEEKNARLEQWLQRRGAIAVILGRLTPGLRIVMTVVAGALKMDRRTFTLGTFFAAILWAAIYFWLGYALGASYEQWLKQAESWAKYVLLGVAAAVLVAVWWKFLRKRDGAAGDGA
jgi:membrane protein DedA with SNARE-associated domain